MQRAIDDKAPRVDSALAGGSTRNPIKGLEAAVSALMAYLAEDETKRGLWLKKHSDLFASRDLALARIENCPALALVTTISCPSRRDARGATSYAAYMRIVGAEQFEMIKPAEP